MKEIMLDFGAILSDLFHALRSGAKKVLIALAVLTALLTALVLYLMTPHTEIRSLTGFRCYFVPRCEVNYQSYHRDNDLYNMGIYKLNGQDAARFVYWAQENGWAKLPDGRSADERDAQRGDLPGSSGNQAGDAGVLEADERHGAVRL